MISIDRLKKGLYWEKAWKLVEGCAKVSPGCDNCWSETETAMHCNHPNEKISSRACLVIDPLTGKFDDTHLRVDNLDLPLRTKTPTVFAIWNDLYHEDVPDEFRDRAYAVMALCPQHVFLVLTKRAERMAEYFYKTDAVFTDADEENFYFPFHNVWHGVSAENQGMADQRIPHLLKIPGKRFVNLEPMLGAVDLRHFTQYDGTNDDDFFEKNGWGYNSYSGGFIGGDDSIYDPQCGIHAVLLGGESGKNSRPLHPSWARSIRDQCQLSNVPFFLKQNGEWAPHEVVFEHRYSSRSVLVATWFADQWLTGSENPTHDGGYPEDEPDVWRVGKKKAGRTLDGKLHDDLPWQDEMIAIHIGF